MIAAILMEGITDDRSRAMVDAGNYSGFVSILVPSDALVL
jgi:hypothetical protein